MGEALANAARIAPLALPVLLGFLAARLRLVRDVPGAIGGLNGFALYFAFPALITGGLLSGEFVVPREVGFWLIVPIVQGLTIGAAWLWARSIGPREHAGTLAICGLWGNVAYLGLPYAIALFGTEASGLAALVVAIHVAGSMALGPFLLARWSGATAPVGWGKLLGQPLLWAPVVGLVARLFPPGVREPFETLITPLGRGAAPAALFMLGLYLFQNRSALRPGVPGVAPHVAARLLAVPGLTAAIAAAFVAGGWMDPAHAGVIVVLAGMPAAITTFSFAQEFGIGQERVAATIVQSTVLCLLTLPILASLAARL